MVTANTLLYKALDYDGFWNSSKKIRESQPSKARRAQLASLLKSFGISKKNAKNISQGRARPGKENVITKTFYKISTQHEPIERLDHIKTLSDLQYLTSAEFIADRGGTKYQCALTLIVSAIEKIFPIRL